MCFGYLAFLQLQYAPLAGLQESEVRGLALWNGIAAAITLFVGARLILGASASDLAGSAIWGVLNVVYGRVADQPGRDTRGVHARHAA
jgi:hypothetical protein